MNLTDRCLVCGIEKRENFESEQRWRSDIWVVVGRLPKQSKYKITICPNCRRKPIEMIYQLIMQKIMEKDVE